VSAIDREISLPMTEVSAAAYDALPYRHGSIPETHPARIGAIARMLGTGAAVPDSCRVLEVGCAEGMNLLPLAERLPGSTFVGLDFSPVQLAAAEQASAAAGIKNARFICADLRDHKLNVGTFDYVIAHGVYSWVSGEAREHLLALSARSLAPNGVAYVSYNVFPAWGLLGGLRAMLRAEITGVPDPQAHIARLLPALERAFAGDGSPYAALMREALAEMRAKPVDLLFHDELESVNDPVTFLEFNTQAERHGLRYLAEAHFPSMPTEHLPPAARNALAELSPDFFRAQHFLDLVGNRRFRNSLLIRGTPPPARVLNPAVIAQCAVGLHMQPAEGVIDLSPDRPLRLAGRNGFQLSISAAAHKAFFAALCEVAPARVSFSAALARATHLLHEAGFDEIPKPEPLTEGVARLFAIDQCDLLLAGAGDWLDLSPQAAPSSLMRYQARTGRKITNRWHETVDLEEADRRWVAGEGPSIREAALVRTGLAF
jgi:SAM-dependent methyltransferase